MTSLSKATSTSLPPSLPLCPLCRCEVRPGPEFLTRSYTFHASRHLRALQHYYSDSACQQPTYSLLVRAKLRLRQASWLTRGATEADHHLQKVGMVVHSPGATQHLSARLPEVCVGLGLGRMVPGKLYELHNARAGRAWLGALGFPMGALGLVRVETQHHPHGGNVQELFLGEVHTDWAQRTHHRPTGYQLPLQNAMVRMSGLQEKTMEHHDDDNLSLFIHPLVS